MVGIEGLASTAAAGVAARAVEPALTALPHVDLGSHQVCDIFGTAAHELEQMLPGYLGDQRWFAGKSHVIESVQLRDVVPVVDDARTHSRLTMFDVAYADAAPERYSHVVVAQPIDSVTDASSLLGPMAVVHAADGTFVLADGMGDAATTSGLLDLVHDGGAVHGRSGDLVGDGGEVLEAALPKGAVRLDVLPQLSSNTNVKVSGDHGAAMLKLVRRHDVDPAPGTPTRALDVWKGAWLTSRGFHNSPAVYGSIEHVDAKGVPRTVATLTGFAPNQGDAWSDALDHVANVLATVRTEGIATGRVDDGIASYAEVARNHGRRLGEMQVQLAAGGPASEFRPVAPETGAEQARFERIRAAGHQAMDQLRASASDVTSNGTVDDLQHDFDAHVDTLQSRARSGAAPDRIHVHGDFHLGQMLRTGDDVQIVDLEGAPSMPMAQRWQRADALGDVARQRSSYEYAAEQGIRAIADSGATPEDISIVRPVASRWADAASSAFLDGWTRATSGASFVPATDDLAHDLQVADIENALHETSYELGSRPEWAHIPVNRLQRLTGTPAQ